MPTDRKRPLDDTSDDQEANNNNDNGQFEDAIVNPEKKLKTNEEEEGKEEKNHNNEDVEMENDDNDEEKDVEMEEKNDEKKADDADEGPSANNVIPPPPPSPKNGSQEKDVEMEENSDEKKADDADEGPSANTAILPPLPPKNGSQISAPPPPPPIAVPPSQPPPPLPKIVPAPPPPQPAETVAALPTAQPEAVERVAQPPRCIPQSRPLHQPVTTTTAVPPPPPVVAQLNGNHAPPTERETVVDTSARVDTSTAAEEKYLVEEELEEEEISGGFLSSTKFWIMLLAILYGILFRKNMLNLPYQQQHLLQTKESLVQTLDGITSSNLFGQMKAVVKENVIAEKEIQEAIEEIEEEEYDDEDDEEIIVEEEEIIKIEEVIEEDDPALFQKYLQALKDLKLLQRYKADSNMVNNLVHTQDAKNRETYASDRISHMEHFVSSVSDQVLPEMEETLLLWEEALDKAELVMGQILDDGNMDQESLKIAKVAMEDLEAYTSTASSKSSIFDSLSIPVPGEGCDGLDHIYVVQMEKKKEKKAKAILAHSEHALRKDVLYDAQAGLKELSTKSAADVLEESSLATNWMENGVDALWLKYKDDHPIDDDDDNDDMEEDIAKAKVEMEPVGGMTNDSIDSEIKKQVDVALADGTGKFDYASILGGASVIRSGRRRTSLSLVDNLPLFNKILSTGRMRFYGHPAEVALVPTYPKDSLGQCWSFESEGVSELRKMKYHKDDAGDKDTFSVPEIADDLGAFASLTVRLSAPVLVSSVVIEHPPKDVSSQTETAVHDVRVLGFEDDEGMGMAWDLGSFQYDIDSKEWAQEFDVATEVDGERVPPLRSITLAIDSNWGSDYSCLYRFRVHGSKAS